MALDLGVFHRKDREISVKEALSWTGVWVLIGLGFNLLIWAHIDRVSGSADPLWPQYLTCYITEYALSVDNIFVFLVIFTYFAVPVESRHRVLFWGVLGALVFRALFLVGGVVLIQRFHWVVYLLALILIVTGAKLFFSGGDEDIEPEKNFVLRLARRFLPVTERYEGQHFFVRRGGRLFATPLFLTLLVVETTDVLFAVDSVPAALGISQDPFVLYTSNVMAIMGLRSLFFAVAGLLEYLHYLKYGLALILCFVGAKMVLPEEHKLPVTVALGVVGGILLAAVVASIVHARKQKKEEPKP
ncbi:MAG: TerC family protein [Planctomycetes bacterium]|nr:TerC family protein [Planctomycetota bacterium]